MHCRLFAHLVACHKTIGAYENRGKKGKNFMKTNNQIQGKKNFDNNFFIIHSHIYYDKFLMLKEPPYFILQMAYSCMP